MVSYQDLNLIRTSRDEGCVTTVVKLYAGPGVRPSPMFGNERLSRNTD